MGIWHTVRLLCSCLILSLVADLLPSSSRAQAAKRNDEIINQLLNGTPTSSFSFDFSSPSHPQQQPRQLPTSYSTSSSLSSMVDSLSPSTPRGTPPPSLPSIPPPPITTPLRKPRPFSSALAESTSSENRILPLPSTPNGSHLSSGYISGSPKPPPLPLAGHQRSNSQARAARRVTIEHDMEKLKGESISSSSSRLCEIEADLFVHFVLAGSSRVEQSKSMFNSPAHPPTPLPRSSNHTINDTPTRKF